MGDFGKRAAILGEIALLRGQQSDANQNAIYLSWTQEQTVEYQKRTLRISDLLHQLTQLGDS